jgi:hypothetical protein
MPQGLFDRDVERRLRLLEDGGGTLSTAPRGVMGIQTLSTAFTTSATHTTFQNEGLTVTASETAGRRWKWTVLVNPYAPGGANGVWYRLLRDGVVMHEWLFPSEAMSTTVNNCATLTHVESISSTHADSVFTIQIAAYPTNTSVSSYATATFRRQMIVEDIGV